MFRRLHGRFAEPSDLAPFSICRYVREAAVRQKIDALGGRSQAQARDVFDLHALVGGEGKDELLTFLAGALDQNQLDAAYQRALSITFAEYEGQVIEFLQTEGRKSYGTEAAWDELRLTAAELIEAVIQRSG